MAGLVIVGNAKPDSASGGGGDDLAAVGREDKLPTAMTKAVGVQLAKRPQSARQTRISQRPPVCNVLLGLLVTSVRRRPHSAGAERHRQHGNADDVWVVETPDQLRARPPSAPNSVRARDGRRPGRTHYRGITRPVRPRTVELATGTSRDGSMRPKSNALQTTAVAMPVRRRCAGVLAPAVCSHPVTWRDYKPSAKNVAREVTAARDAADSATARRAAATRAAKQPKPGPAGFGTRSARSTQNHKGEQVAGALLGRPAGVHTVETEQAARAFLIGGASPRHTQQDAFKRADCQDHDSAARMAMDLAQKTKQKTRKNSSLNLRATYEAALKFGQDGATLGAAAREAEILLEAEKIMRVSRAHGRVRKEVMSPDETAITGEQPSVPLTPKEPSVPLTPKEQAEELDVHIASGNTERCSIQLPRPHVTSHILPTATLELQLDDTAHSGVEGTGLETLQAGRA